MSATKIFLTVGFLTCIALAAATVTLAQNETEDPNARIRELLTEKRDVMATRVEYAASQFESGKMSPQSLFRARIDLLEAKLPLAESKAERVQIRESQRDFCRELEKVLREQYLIGTATIDECYLATAGRIDAEIALERAKQEAP